MSIALDQVTKRYQSVPVVNDVSLKVEQGEFLVLLGPSGSGKSTLLRAIAGLTEIDHGRVSLHGRDVTGVSAREREVGFVFQHYALFRHMTVANNIEFALQVRGVRAAERRARRDELLRLVALEGMANRLPGELSGGQQQRVAVARALAHRPQVLLMDEPFGALDAKIREELRRTIRQIQRELGIATIFVTHDQEEAFALADRIGVMHQGRLLECGPPEDLYARPATRFVATFLGAANLLLGYRQPEGVRFASPAVEASPPREVVSVLRPEEVELAAAAENVRSNFVGYGVVEEVLFGGAVERLRVRMAPDGPMPVAPGGDDAVGALLEASRTLPEQRQLPVAVGQRIAVGARRIHVLPTPISSFTIVSEDEAEASALRGSPLLAMLADRMQTRLIVRLQPGAAAPPGMPVVAAGPGSARSVAWQLDHGAEQLLCLPESAPMPGHVVIVAADIEARSRTFAVAASLLRHIPAEAVYLSIHAADTPPPDRAEAMRALLDARSAALADHGLDMRTEIRLGDPLTELLRELLAHEPAMLVVGIGAESAAATEWLPQLIEGPVQRPVLIVPRACRRAIRRDLTMAGGFRKPSVLPGFGLTFGFTTFFLSALVLLPLAALVLKASAVSWPEFLSILLDERSVASYRLSFGAAFLAAVVNAVFGFIVAWSLVRYDFPGRRLVDAFIDLPFAMPTAVSGIALATVFSPSGWLGQKLALAGVQVAYTWLGVVVALILIGLPFVVRSVQPALVEVQRDLEDAAETLGARPWQVFRRIILPAVLPALLTGFTLAFARGIGEYGSVVFISGNLPMKTEITPLLIVIKLEQYDYNGAAALGFIMLVMSFVMLFAINLVQAWGRRRQAGMGR